MGYILVVITVTLCQAMNIEYFELPELPGHEFFNCDRCCGTFQTSSCAAMWRIANSKRRSEANAKCRSCPIGAVHAGEGDGQGSRIYGVDLCARCNRVGMRLIHSDICVSCWNRAREVIVGKNARGRIPLNHPPISHYRITILTGNRLVVVDREHAIDTVELIVAALRDNARRVLFGFRSNLSVDRSEWCES